MEPLTQQSIDDQRLNNPGFDWFFNALEEFLHALANRLVQIENGDAPHGIPQTNGQPCGVCNLTFYFYFSPGGGYRNGIWVDVDNINHVDVWFRVGINHNGTKKVDIFARCLLNCPDVALVPRKYALPHQFNHKGIYKTEQELEDIGFDIILDRICGWMQCVCLSNCL
jgi:hypothetical protein